MKCGKQHWKYSKISTNLVLQFDHIFFYVIDFYFIFHLCFDFIRKSQFSYLFFDFIFFLQGLDINVKWPNDIYANGERKIGGLIVNSTIEADQAICNIGNDGKLLCHLLWLGHFIWDILCEMGLKNRQWYAVVICFFFYVLW